MTQLSWFLLLLLKRFRSENWMHVSQMSKGCSIASSVQLPKQQDCICSAFFLWQLAAVKDKQQVNVVHSQQQIISTTRALIQWQTILESPFPSSSTCTEVGRMFFWQPNYTEKNTRIFPDLLTIFLPVTPAQRIKGRCYCTVK